MRVVIDRQRNEDGASAVEYGLLAVAIAGAITIVVFALGGLAVSMFSTTCGNLHGQMTSVSANC